MRSDRRSTTRVSALRFRLGRRVEDLRRGCGLGARCSNVSAKVRQRFLDGRLDRLGASFDLAHQHGALDRGDAEVGQSILIGPGSESSPRLFPDEEGPQLVLYDLEQVAQVLPDELVRLRHPVGDGAERAAAQHAKPLLQLDVRGKPAFQVLPGADLIVDGAGACLHALDVAQQHLVDQSLLAAEIVIELALARPRGFQDLVRARCTDTLLMEEIGRRAHDAQPSRRSLFRFPAHDRPPGLYLRVQYLDSYAADTTFRRKYRLYLYHAAKSAVIPILVEAERLRQEHAAAVLLPSQVRDCTAKSQEESAASLRKFEGEPHACLLYRSPAQ